MSCQAPLLGDAVGALPIPQALSVSLLHSGFCPLCDRDILGMAELSLCGCALRAAAAPLSPCQCRALTQPGVPACRAPLSLLKHSHLLFTHKDRMSSDLPALRGQLQSCGSKSILHIQRMPRAMLSWAESRRQDGLVGPWEAAFAPAEEPLELLCLGCWLHPGGQWGLHRVPAPPLHHPPK